MQWTIAGHIGCADEISTSTTQTMKQMTQTTKVMI